LQADLAAARYQPLGLPLHAGGRAAVGDQQARHDIRYGLGAVKGSGQGAIEAIIAARQSGGNFKDLFDFCQRVDRKQINRRTIESLIRAGAMDCFGVDRAILLASVAFAVEVADQALASVNQVQPVRRRRQRPGRAARLRQATPWTDRQKLAEEKIALGFYLSAICSIPSPPRRAALRAPSWPTWTRRASRA